MPKHISLISVLILTSTATQAALVFQIDAGTKLITASGSVSGTTDSFFSPQGGVDWDGNFVGITSATAGTVNLSAITTSFASGGPGTVSFPTLTLSGMTINVSASVDFVDEFSPAGFNAAGGSVSYAGLDASQIALIEELGGAGFSVSSGGFGTGQQPISFTLVGASPIPEPSTYIAGAGFVSLLGLIALRRRKAKSVVATTTEA
ncbi:PEP-CTERM sorting domain-containing protein [Cerasicoccus maritimus]|uniref:PEP-CTERM sorting domain-containing protein n=1 Tax=Cerasicoccus maritimus TaxID=490089 RepID=UPI00285298D7|nr:PEP-CTERM sorting domain-containing protein [Cerasicoccus maritimus]